jgi:hypothetical protein
MNTTTTIRDLRLQREKPWVILIKEGGLTLQLTTVRYFLIVLFISSQRIQLLMEAHKMGEKISSFNSNCIMPYTLEIFHFLTLLKNAWSIFPLC